MREGWHKDDYLILFDPSEVVSATARYELESVLPGHSVLGLLGWDDFIVRNSAGELFTVPTVPIDRLYVSPFVQPKTDVTLRPDSRYQGKIKWYITPIVFGGDSSIGENLTWITHDQHAELVGWWNKKYRELKSGG